MKSVEFDEEKGLILNIQRFSLHDGPGIRTTVFMKGCPLRCRWCCNPESWNPFPEIITFDVRCIRCGKCEEVCQMGAITVDPKGRKLNFKKCNLCLKCGRICPTGAIRITGELWTVQETVEEVERDKLFYQHSDGGVTISGGEPLLQWKFALQALKAIKQKGLNTVLDTCGYSSWNTMEKVLAYTDLVLFDLKHMGPEQHRRGIGKSNSLVLSNARKTSARVKTWLRFPLIPGYNDSKENIVKTAEFGARIGIGKVSLLPYHDWGKPKYKKMGRRYILDHTQPPSDEQCEEALKIFESFGLKADTGA